MTCLALLLAGTALGGGGVTESSSPEGAVPANERINGFAAAPVNGTVNVHADSSCSDV